MLTELQIQVLKLYLEEGYKPGLFLKKLGKSSLNATFLKVLKAYNHNDFSNLRCDNDINEAVEETLAEIKNLKLKLKHLRMKEFFMKESTNEPK